MNIFNTALFIFSIIIILIPTITIYTSSLVYFKTKKIIFLYASFLLATIVLDALFLHYTDFYHFVEIAVPDTFISLAPFKIALFSIMLIVEMLIILDIFKMKVRVKYFIFIVFFIAIEILFKTMKEDNLTIWLFYSTRQLFSILLCLYFYYSYVRCADETIKASAKRFINIIAILILLNLIIGIEDALVSSQQVAFSSSGLIFKERNFTENLYWMVISIIILAASTTYISKMIIPEVHQEKTNFTAFGTFIQLTKRENEILNLILEHLSNSEIADRLCISSGTLKAHIHNIYVKANVTHRNELIKKAYDFIDDNEKKELDS